MIEQDFLDKIPKTKVKAFEYILNGYRDYTRPKTKEFLLHNYDTVMEYYSLVKTFLTNYQIKPKILKPVIGGDKPKNIDKVSEFFSKLHEYFYKTETLKFLGDTDSKYETLFSKEFTYEFTTGDFKKIQSLINELRDLITASELFEDDHKRRLLIKLENLQKTVHKKVSNLDMIYGLIGETGVVLGKFGKDAKPFVDMIKEIVNIGWRTQARAEELESSSKLPGLEILKEIEN